MASARISGMKELMENLAALEKTGHKVKDEIIRECAEEVRQHLYDVAPIDSKKTTHGRDCIKVVTVRDGYNNGSFYVDIGLKDSGKDWPYRGLHFQEYKTDEPHYKWMTRGWKEIKAPVQRKMKAKIKQKIEEIKFGGGK